MEQDIIVEGFLQSISMHGLVNHRLIADGDISVHKKLIDAMPYGTTRQVEIVDNTKLGSYELRSALKDRIMRLRTAGISAVQYRKKQSEDKYHLLIEELRNDILTSSFHIRGDHSKCSERQYFCDGLPKPGEVNLVNEMEKAGLLK
ncbi:hypothetical protein PR048_013288 [Dryococelus australis]|uniref:Mutator-like transposase domain-containing protein n=1 Tax=Dryococelus australis TaxID=614101 RepID=A0ABQ9HRQ9_9NEOP|nr:hypothetical protein PR048_013288 [Dryococelus australis]